MSRQVGISDVPDDELLSFGDGDGSIPLPMGASENELKVHPFQMGPGGATILTDYCSKSFLSI